MTESVEKKLAALFGHSTFLTSVAALNSGRRVVGEERSLTKKEIAVLTANGNTAGDWSTVRVAAAFRPDFIRNTMLYGACRLGVFSGAPREAASGITLPSGIYGSTIVDSEIGDECLVKNCGLIANYTIAAGAVVMDVGALTAGRECAFGNGMAISVGREAGGREVLSCAELDIELATHLALKRDDKDVRDRYMDLAARYREKASCGFGIVEAGAALRRTTRISDVFVGAGAAIDGAILVENCTVLSSPEEPAEISHGALVKNSCLQWGCLVSSMAIVTESLLTEHVHVERQAKVSSSILGPNTGVAEGEVTSCLLGPFVGFHHQSLLIAALWPEGKGNVACGANVGSNHTSRAPDQEIICGEGVFFGLGTNIKFPADYAGAPYSIIATGVDTLPQKVLFPFSLIAGPSRSFSDLSPAYNQISPGWVLSENVYMVRRNEDKYRRRNRARRTTFDFTVFRPDIVDMMVTARNRLREVKAINKTYSERDIPGLGKNFLLEESRLRGIDTYTFYIEYYCLAGMRDRVRELLAAGGRDRLKTVYSDATDCAAWEHQRSLLPQEHVTERSLKENLERLIEVLNKIETDTLRSKAKDDERGVRIIRDYHDVAVTAENDAFIKSAREAAAREVGELETIISVLPG